MPAATGTPIAASARAIQDWIVSRRRHLHEHPELSFQEKNTSAFVERELRSLGFQRIETRLNNNHGLCAELLGRDRGRCIALRADMDALPIQEETEWPHKSRVAGVSHMCGHDAHTSMLLGAARLLKEREAELPCTVRLFFQGGEEKFPGGARDFIEAGLLEGVDHVFGLHVDPRKETGFLAMMEGPMMAGVDEFTITVNGFGGHAAYPHGTKDPVYCAAQIITALQQIVSRNTDPFEPAVVSVCRIQGGSAFNVIPSNVVIDGTVRSFRADMHTHFSGLIRRVIDGISAACGCTVDLNMPEGYPALTNAASAMEMMRRAAAEVIGDGVVEADQIMGSEDFALYTREVPSCFGFLGVSHPADQDRYFVHHPKFHIDEDALWRGTAILANVAMRG